MREESEFLNVMVERERDITHRVVDPWEQCTCLCSVDQHILKDQNKEMGFTYSHKETMG